MKNKYDEGTFIFGSYYSAEEINEIKTNPNFKDSLAKAILEFRETNEKFKQELLETRFFKLMDKIVKKIDGLL